MKVENVLYLRLCPPVFKVSLFVSKNSGNSGFIGGSRKQNYLNEKSLLGIKVSQSKLIKLKCNRQMSVNSLPMSIATI